MQHLPPQSHGQNQRERAIAARVWKDTKSFAGGHYFVGGGQWNSRMQQIVGRHEIGDAVTQRVIRNNGLRSRGPQRQDDFLSRERRVSLPETRDHTRQNGAGI